MNAGQGRAFMRYLPRPPHQHPAPVCVPLLRESCLRGGASSKGARCYGAHCYGAHCHGAHCAAMARRPRSDASSSRRGGEGRKPALPSAVRNPGSARRTSSGRRDDAMPPAPPKKPALPDFGNKSKSSRKQRRVSLLHIPVIGSIARGDQRLTCPMRGFIEPRIEQFSR